MAALICLIQLLLLLSSYNKSIVEVQGRTGSEGARVGLLSPQAWDKGQTFIFSFFCFISLTFLHVGHKPGGR